MSIEAEAALLERMARDLRRARPWMVVSGAIYALGLLLFVRLELEFVRATFKVLEVMAAPGGSVSLTPLLVAFGILGVVTALLMLPLVLLGRAVLVRPEPNLEVLARVVRRQRDFWGSMAISLGVLVLAGGVASAVIYAVFTQLSPTLKAG